MNDDNPILFLQRSFAKLESKKNKGGKYGSTNRTVKKNGVHVKIAKAQSHFLQTHMHSKSRKSTPNFEIKNRRHSTNKRGRQQWLITHLKTYKSKPWHHPVRVATSKVDQEGYDSNNACGLLLQTCENPDLISQN